MGDLHSFLAQTLRLENEDIRFWVLSVNGISQSTLILDDSISLHKLGAFINIQVNSIFDKKILIF